MKRVVLYFILGSAISCLLLNGGLSMSMQPAKAEEMTLEVVLRDFIDEKIACKSQFSIKYHVGNEFAGFTDFKVNGEGVGTLKSNVTEGRVVYETTFKLKAKEVMNLVQTFVNHEFWKIKAVREQGFEDEVKDEITVAYRAQTWSKSLWLEEAKENESFKAVEGVILSLIGEISEGEVLEIGAQESP